MESWQGLNYLTKNPTKWVELMNLSTVEWGVGYLPAGVVAIPGKLNVTYNLPAGTIVIQNASKSEVGSRDVEKIIFGITSGVVILWAGIWLYLNRLKFSTRGTEPLLPTGSDAASHGTSITLNNRDENFVSASEFYHQLRYFYYESEKSEPEIKEKNLDEESVEADDIEKATALLREMFNLDLMIWAKQSSRQTTRGERAEMMAKSDAILAEVNRLVAAWDVNLNDPRRTAATDMEKQEMMEIVEILRQIGPQRYPNKYSQNDSYERRSRRNDRE